jgi:hypothetical protein
MSTRPGREHAERGVSKERKVPTARGARGEKPDEIEARRIVAATVGWAVHLHDVGGQSQYDYTIDHPAGPHALEVVRNTDLAATKNVAAFDQYSEPVLIDQLRWSWQAMLLQPGVPRMKGLAEKLVPIAAALEKVGLDSSQQMLWSAPEHVALRQLGVLWLTALRRGPGQVALLLGAGDSAGVRPEEPIEEVEAFLHGDKARDVRDKLHRSGLARRHAFVWVDRRSPMRAWRALGEQDLPQRAPQLPREVSDVWIVFSKSAGWYWSAGGGWRSVHRPA